MSADFVCEVCGKRWQTARQLAGHRGGNRHGSMEHGTYSMYQQHVRKRTPACAACLAANRRQQQAWRTRTGDVKNAARNIAKSRAWTRLSRLYPDVFAQLLDEELAHNERASERTAS